MPKGGRKASPTLWAMVRGLSEEEWQLVSMMAVMRFKEPLQFKLLTLLRSMDVYDPAAEKAAFADNNLGSMRRTARKWLIRTASKMAFYQSEVALQVMDVDVLLGWGIHDETMEFIAEAKQFAKEQEEFGWLGILYKKELKAAAIIFKGDERISKVEEIAREAMENGKLVALDAEIDLHTAQYLEKARHQLLTTGKFDETYTESYFQSKFFRQNIDAWPISYQIQKLRLDEGLHYFLGRTAEAAKAAEKLRNLIKQLEKIRKSESEDHARCLFRLSAYYTALDRRQKVIGILEEIRTRAMSESPIRFTYLRRLPYSLFHASFQFGIPSFGEMGLEAWNENKTILNSLQKDVVLFQTHIFVSFYHLSTGNTKAAREVFGQAYEHSDSFPFVALQAVFQILHLMLLIDEDDERGLKSYGKRYKRYLTIYLKDEVHSLIAIAALEFVMLLAKESNLEGKSKLRKSLGKLLERLRSYQHSVDTTFNPHLHPMIGWTELRLR